MLSSGDDSNSHDIWNQDTFNDWYSEKLYSEYVCDSVAQMVNEFQSEACLRAWRVLQLHISLYYTKSASMPLSWIFIEARRSGQLYGSDNKT